MSVGIAPGICQYNRLLFHYFYDVTEISDQKACCKEIILQTHLFM